MLTCTPVRNQCFKSYKHVNNFFDKGTKGDIGSDTRRSDNTEGKFLCIAVVMYTEVYKFPDSLKF